MNTCGGDVTNLTAKLVSFRACIWNLSKTRTSTFQLWPRPYLILANHFACLTSHISVFKKQAPPQPELYHVRHPKKSPKFWFTFSFDLAESYPTEHFSWKKPRSLISAHGTLPKITTANSRFTRFNRSAKGPSAKLVAPGEQRGNNEIMSVEPVNVSTLEIFGNPKGHHKQNP